MAKGVGMGKLALLVLGIALGLTAAVFVSAYATRRPSPETSGEAG